MVFSGGSGGVETKPDPAQFAAVGTSHSKNFDNRSDNYRSFKVSTYRLLKPTDGLDNRKILEIGLNGWETDPGTTIKDIEVNGLKGIDSVRVVEIGHFTIYLILVPICGLLVPVSLFQGIDENMKILSWWTIILILVGVALVSGLLFGLLGDLLGLSQSMKSGGIGVSVGVVAAFLIVRRTAINKQANR